MSAKSNGKLLSDLLERIIFNEKDFDDLKSAIVNVCTGKNDPRLLKEKVIACRVRILEELKDLFPFYINQVMKKQSIKRFAENESETYLIEDLNEKNEFFVEIGDRIEKIFKKLRDNAKNVT